ncbi:MAG: flagellar protein FlgJ [Polaribacter sp.]|jgi:flagellar protein FlgJ
MSVSSPTDFYLNQHQYSEMKLGARNQSIETTKAVAEQFESLFVQQMLASMRSAAKVDESNHSSTLDFYQEMYDKQLALDISKQGGLGIAKVLLQQLPGGVQMGSEQASADQSMEGLLALASGKGGKLLPIGTVPQMPFLPLANPPVINLSEPNLQATYRPEVEAPLTISTMYQTDTYRTQNPAVKVTQYQTDDLQISESDAVLANQVGSKQRWLKPEHFITDLWPHAQKAANAIGISAQALVAQSALETGWGKHTMRFPNGQQAFNLFGIKASNNWDGPTLTKPTLEFRDGVMQTEMAHFRAYESIPDALDDYVEFIQASPRYQNALDHKGDDAHYLKELQQGGYATDPQYAKKIINIMQGQTIGVSIANFSSDQRRVQENNNG